MLFRLPRQGDPWKFAVDTEGQLILAQWEGTGDDQVIYVEEGPYYSIMAKSDAQIPAFAEWGTAPQKAVLTGDYGEFEIAFKGQRYNVSDNGTKIEPEVEDYEP